MGKVITNLVFLQLSALVAYNKVFMEFLLGLLSRLPLRVLYWISDIAYPILYYIVAYRKQVAEKNLAESFPEKSPEELKKLEKAFYKYFCDAVVEMVKLYSMSEEEVKKRFVFKNAEQLSSDLKEGRSYFLLMSHHCNWEYLTSVPLWLDKSAFSSHVYKRLVDERFDKIMVKMRDKFGSHSIEDKKLFRTLAVLRKKGTPIATGFLADQSPMPDGLNYWCNFLNHEHTPFLDSPERVARSFGFGMYYFEPIKIKRGYYECNIIKLCDNVADTPEHEITGMYARLLEKTVQNQPECYLWTHNRWKFTDRYDGKDEKLRCNNS